MTRTDEGMLRWRDWLVDNCPDDVLDPQARDALREVPKERVSAYFGLVHNQTDPCGPLNFFTWAATRLPSAPKSDWERYKFWFEANDKVADYLRTWYDDEDVVMQLVIQQHQ